MTSNSYVMNNNLHTKKENGQQDVTSGKQQRKTSEIIERVYQILLENRSQASKVHQAFLDSRLDYIRQLIKLNKFDTKSSSTNSIKKQPVIYDRSDLEEFSVGSIENCLGQEFAIRRGFITPRIPNGDLLLMNRVVSISGNRNEFLPGSNIVTEYDVPKNVWFYEDNAYPYLPISAIRKWLCNHVACYPLILAQRSYTLNRITSSVTLMDKENSSMKLMCGEKL